jgi:hypothetical protein
MNAGDAGRGGAGPHRANSIDAGGETPAPDRVNEGSRARGGGRV